MCFCVCAVGFLNCSNQTKKEKGREGASLDVKVHFETGEHVFGRYFWVEGVEGGGIFFPPPLFVCVVNPGAAAGLRV